MNRGFVSFTVKKATPSSIEGLYTCPASWLPERTCDVAESLGLIDENGMVLISEEWKDKPWHARSVFGKDGTEHKIQDNVGTTY